MAYFIKKDCIDTEIKDKNGKLAIDLAKIRGHTEVVDYINRYNRDRRSYFCNIK
jgi:hypothetical protein